MAKFDSFQQSALVHVENFKIMQETQNITTVCAFL